MREALRHTPVGWGVLGGWPSKNWGQRCRCLSLPPRVGCGVTTRPRRWWCKTGVVAWQWGGGVGRGAGKRPLAGRGATRHGHRAGGARLGGRRGGRGEGGIVVEAAGPLLADGEIPPRLHRWESTRGWDSPSGRRGGLRPVGGHARPALCLPEKDIFKIHWTRMHVHSDRKTYFKCVAMSRGTERFPAP